METKEKQKLILAVLSGDDYEDTISALTENGFFVTVLNSSGGFFRRKNVTVMIGTDSAKCERVLEILRENAGLREQTTYQNLSAPGCEQMAMLPPMAIKKNAGGATVFIMDLDSIEKL